jgi:hypothetical protein
MRVDAGIITLRLDKEHRRDAVDALSTMQDENNTAKMQS